MPGMAVSCALVASGSAVASRSTSPAATASARGAQRRRARRGHPDGTQVVPRHRVGGRKRPREARPAQVVRQRLSQRADEPAGQRRRALHRHLLAQDDAHGQLEAVPGAGDTDPGQRFERAGQHRSVRQMGTERQGIRVEIEKPAQSGRDVQEDACVRVSHLRIQTAAAPGFDVHQAGSRRFRGVRGEPATVCARYARKPKRAPVDAPHGIDDFDAGHGPWRQKAQHRRCVVRGAVAQPEAQRTGRLSDCGLRAAARLPERARRAAVGPVERVVEAADAAEAGCLRHGGQRQIGGVDEALGAVQAARRRNPLGRRADVPFEEPPQVPRADPEPPREAVRVVMVQRPVLDQAQRAAHRARGAVPGRRAGGRLRPAAQAGAEAGPTRRRGRGVEAHVGGLRRLDRADRPTVDAGGHDADEEAAVETCVARQAGSFAQVGVQHHQHYSAAAGDALAVSGPDGHSRARADGTVGRASRSGAARRRRRERPSGLPVQVVASGRGLLRRRARIRLALVAASVSPSSMSRTRYSGWKVSRLSTSGAWTSRDSESTNQVSEDARQLRFVLRRESRNVDRRADHEELDRPQAAPLSRAPLRGAAG